MKKRLSICPFTKREYAIIEQLSSTYIIQDLIAPKGVGTELDDIAKLRAYPNTGIHFCNSIEKGIGEADIVLIANVESTEGDIYDFAYEALKYSATHGKEIISFLPIPEIERTELLDLSAQHGAQCAFLDNCDKMDLYETKIWKLDKFEVPVLYICDLFPDCDSYDVFLSLCQNIKKRGYKVLGVSNDIYNSLFDLNYFNFDAHLPVHEQVARISNAVHQMYNNAYPDIIIVYLPQPIFKFDEDTYFDAGVSAFMISQSVPGDAGILCVPFSNSHPQFLEKITEAAFERLGYPIIGVHISNQVYNNVKGIATSLVRLPLKKTLEQVKQIQQFTNKPLFNISDNGTIKSLTDLIVNEYLNLSFGVI